MTTLLTRREWMRATGAAGLGLAASTLPTTALAKDEPRVRVLSIGVTGTIGGHDRAEVASHPNAEIVGLCDVDSLALEQAAEQHPKAFRCRDYREAFRTHGDEFDAVIVATPDHTHAPILLTALTHAKHIYGQKPLVQQLEEIVILEQALEARPNLVTQTGNQRMVYPGRRAAVDILQRGLLGKAIEAHVWVGSPDPGMFFNFDRVLSDPKEAPEHLDWNLWLGPCAERPFREHLAPIKWRSWWDFGTGGLGDWGVHVLDVIFFAYDELTSPTSVLTHAPKAADRFHTFPCRSTITYEVESERFVNKRFPIYYSDRNQAPARAALGLPPGRWNDANMTVVVCEGGVLTLTAGGTLEIWRDGEMTDGLSLPDLPEYPELNHWHAWIDNIIGVPTELRTPFRDGARMTEAALLAVKATRFPGQELVWDKSSLSFRGHSEATESIVRRDYRRGFEPPRLRLRTQPGRR